MVEGVETHPYANRIRTDLKDWQADPTTLNLEWSHSGEWARVPVQQNQPGGPEYHSDNVGRIEYYVDTNGVKRRAMAYGDDSEKLLVWYDVEDMLGKMEWIIPDTSPWANSRKWRNEYRVSPLPKIKNSGRGSAPRGNAPRGSAPRGSASRGRIYTHTQTQRGRGHGSQDSWREDNSYQKKKYTQQDPYWGQYEGYDWEPRSSGAGRTSGPASNPRRDREVKPGYNSRREDSRDRREDRYRKNSYRQDGYWTDRSSSREGRRDHGKERARRSGYRRGT